MDHGDCCKQCSRGRPSKCSARRGRKVTLGRLLCCTYKRVRSRRRSSHDEQTKPSRKGPEQVDHVLPTFSVYVCVCVSVCLCVCVSVCLCARVRFFACAVRRRMLFRLKAENNENDFIQERLAVKRRLVVSSSLQHPLCVAAPPFVCTSTHFSRPRHIPHADTRVDTAHHST